MPGREGTDSSGSNNVAPCLVPTFDHAILVGIELCSTDSDRRSLRFCSGPMLGVWKRLHSYTSNLANLIIPKQDGTAQIMYRHIDCLPHYFVL